MAKSDAAAQLEKQIKQLQQERSEHVAAIEQIDATFARYGIDPGTPVAGARRGRRPGPAKKTAGRRRKRGSFSVSGEESVLEFVKKHGKPNAAEVNAHWRAEGRGGKADNALSKLVKAGQLKRVEAKGERGGRYVVA